MMKFTTGVVALFAALALFHVPNATAADAKPIRVTSGNLIVDPTTHQPKVVLSLYEDFLCPYCGEFEKNFGATVNKLIDTGAVEADYYMVSILDRPNRDYSSRAGAAGYCMADQSSDAFRRFHAALYAQQPDESAASFPTDAQLIDTAKQAGAPNAADCINNGTYVSLVRGMAQATNIEGTPTIRINGQDYDRSTPDALVASIEQIVGHVPGLDTPAPPAPPTRVI
jgi:protein-disulfide isomerase